MTRTFLCFILISSSLSFGSQIEFVGTPNVESIAGINIPIYPGALVKQIDGSTMDVKRSGSGIRKSTVVFVQVNVYHVSSYVMFPELLNPTNPISGIELSPTRMLYITALRPLTGSDIRTTMEQALEYNGVDLSNPLFEKLMAEVEGMNVKPGDQFIFGATPGVSEQRIFFELPEKTFEAEGAGIAVDLWRIWFGKPFDSGLKELQKQLVGKKPKSMLQALSSPF